MLVNKKRKYDFEDVAKDSRTIIEKIMQNQNLLKLLYYTDEDALSHDDIENAEIYESIAKHNLIDKPFIEKPLNNGALVVITFTGFQPNGTNPAFLDSMMSIDVLAHEAIWNLKGYEKRVFAIMSEIQKEVHNTKFNGIGKTQFITSDLLLLSDLAGYQLTYQIINDA